MNQDPFQLDGDCLSGRGLTFDVAVLAKQKTTSDERSKCLVEIAEGAFRQGRESALMPWDDRFDMHNAVEVLRALGTVMGPTPTGDRYRRAADILARLLQDQEHRG